jgi:hypothetical protein
MISDGGMEETPLFVTAAGSLAPMNRPVTKKGVYNLSQSKEFNIYLLA